MYHFHCILSVLNKVLTPCLNCSDCQTQLVNCCRSSTSRVYSVFSMAVQVSMSLSKERLLYVLTESKEDDCIKLKGITLRCHNQNLRYCSYAANLYSATSIIRHQKCQIEIVGGPGRFYARKLLICQLSTS